MQRILNTTGASIDLNTAALRHPALIAKIAAYDPKLVIYHDSAVACYGIARMTEMGCHFIALWADEDGHPLPLDNRLYQAIVSWDLRPQYKPEPENVDDHCNKLEQAQDSYQEKAERDFDDDITHLTKDNRRSLYRAIGKL